MRKLLSLFIRQPIGSGFKFCLALLFLPLFAKTLLFGQASSNLKQNKFGVSPADIISPAYELESSTLTGQKSKVFFNAPGVEIYYERFYDDFFAYGLDYLMFAPSTVKVTVPYSTYIGVGVDPIPLDNEVYKAQFIMMGPGVYFKTYIRPNKSAGMKPYMSVGANLLIANVNLTREANTQSTSQTKTTIKHSVLMRYIAGGVDYMLKSGLGVRAGARFVSGFNSQSYQFAGEEKKYSIFYVDSTVLVELGVFYMF